MAEFEDERPAHGLEFDGEPWLLVSSADLSSTRLRRLDPDTAEVIAEREVPWTFWAQVEVYGSRWVGWTENPEPDLHPDGEPVSATTGLVVEFDPRSGETLQTIPTRRSDLGLGFPLFLHGDDYWYGGSSFGSVDLAESVSHIGHHYWLNEGRGWRHDGDAIWSVHRENIVKFDLEAREPVLYPLAFDRGSYRYYDGRYWFQQWGEDHWVPYDHQTGEIGDERLPGADMPDRIQVLGGYRWVTYADGTVHQVDDATGETVERFDFGDYEPWFSASGYVWLLDYRLVDDEEGSVRFDGATVGRIVENPDER